MRRFFAWLARAFLALITVRSVVFGIAALVRRDWSAVALAAVFMPFQIAFAWVLWQIDPEPRARSEQDA